MTLTRRQFLTTLICSPLGRLKLPKPSEHALPRVSWEHSRTFDGISQYVNTGYQGDVISVAGFFGPDELQSQIWRQIYFGKPVRLERDVDFEVRWDV